jgi:para-nitrobenzyl esterase
LIQDRSVENARSVIQVIETRCEPMQHYVDIGDRTLQPHSDITVFKGIPYAQAPIGDLRWRPPQALAASQHYTPSDRLGRNAPQRLLFPDIDAFSAGQSEDCLYLNVWTPVKLDSDERAAVLFYIHGGGFAVGFGGEKRYDGTRLAARGIVVVTMNYRLNALGLLAHPALTAETGSSGNFAMLDLIEALKWVKRNIAQFGGDPDQVTIAGESAGSMFVSMLMSSPLARGLFHRAIGESGAEFPTHERAMQHLQQAEEYGLAFAAKLKAKSAADLRAASVEAILDAHPGLGFWPIVDGHVLTEEPVKTFARGTQADVPVLAGWNKHEGMNFNMLKWPIGKKGYPNLLKVMFGENAKDVEKRYPGGRRMQSSARELSADILINHRTWQWLEAHRKSAKSDIFRYRFDRGPNTTWFPDEPVQGAFHSCEIPYFMDNLDAFDWTISAEDHAVAKLSAGYVVNFVKTGHPNGEGLPLWPRYREESRPLMLIDAEPALAHDLERERYDLLARLLR